MHSSSILYQIMERGPFIRFIAASEHCWRPNTAGLLYQKQLIEFGGPKSAGNLSQWFGFKSQAREQTRSEFTKIHSVGAY